ncbi:hypothetical protein NEIFLAOT_02041 [Neisseria flavescens NRL30031/H210]|uniref:Uncharacterized protein n=1 Tax=Neisseria flavescens NRL30031/H210 TaxID=546264 RepID=C0EQ00_NEIFL|nr:hypothetical protein NEIFLAOT_02041 [Neisseria flavescens NRL30031/H210]
MNYTFFHEWRKGYVSCERPSESGFQTAFVNNFTLRNIVDD